MKISLKRKIEIFGTVDCFNFIVRFLKKDFPINGKIRETENSFACSSFRD